MDITCASCGEPWSWYHMRYDEVYECDINDAFKKSFTGKLTYPYNDAFRDNGWEFACNNIMCIIRCPCCPKESVPDSEEKMRRQVVAELLGDDIDGAASILSE